MSCHKKNNMIPNPCTDPCKPNKPCGCIPNQFDHCIIVSEDLSNLKAERGSKLKEALKSIDDYLGRLKEEISTAKTFIIRNVGGGAKVFKGISLFGRRDFRSIVAEDDTITVTEEEDEIKIKSNYDTVEIKTSSGITGGGQLKDNLEFKIDPDYESFNNYYNKTEVYNKTEIDEEVVGDGRITIKDGVSDLGFFNTNDHNNKSIDIKPAIGDGKVSFRREGEIVDSFTANQKTDKIIDLGDLRGYPGADLEARYSKNTSFSSPPSLNNTSRNPAGWSKTVPTTVVGEYVWFTTATIDYEDNLEGVWTTPIRFTGDPGKDGTDGQDGDDGVTGYNSITLSLYRRGASKPSRPASGAKYNFTTNILASTPSGWSREVPNDNGQPCWISTTTIITREEEVTIATSSWTDPVKFVESGEQGNSTAVVFLYTTTNESTTPTQPTSLNYNFTTGNLTGDKGVWTETVPINSDPIIWFTVGNAVSNSNTVDITNWSTPAILSKPGTPGERGPSVVFRGTWNNKATYHGSEDRVDFVIMPGTTNGYITTIDAGNISGDANKPTTATAKWNGPIANSDAIFTDFLIAYSAYIDNLTVGAIQTGPTPTASDTVPGDASTDFERTTIGYNPPAKVGTLDYEDPTSGWSRHGIRQYWPNGRIMSYQGYVDEYVHEDIAIIKEWALIVWLEDGEPSYYQSKSGDVKKYIEVGTTNPTMSRVGVYKKISDLPKEATQSEIDLEASSLTSLLTNEMGGTTSIVLGPSDAAYFIKDPFGSPNTIFNSNTGQGYVNKYDKGDRIENEDKYEAIYMQDGVYSAILESDAKTSPPLIPNGWYVTTPHLLENPEIDSDSIRYFVNVVYYEDGRPTNFHYQIDLHTKTQ